MGIAGRLLSTCAMWVMVRKDSNLKQNRIWDNGGARNRTRTCDPLLTKQPLCQLSYSSIVVTVTSALVPSVVQLIGVTTGFI